MSGNFSSCKVDKLQDRDTSELIDGVRFQEWEGLGKYESWCAGECNNATPSAFARGCLRSCLKFWGSLGVLSSVHSVLVPLSETLSPVSFDNHKSALTHADFVSEAIADLVGKGSVAKVDRSAVHICSPLRVVEQLTKLHLIPQ